ncbi:MAG: 1-(5-phosphoribosyl)-5-[(5-phosphoribosylamino)methylideneamino]imidazole-4-carboxamide isomerase [Saprospiraceae bacterium]|nr:1-(5-phosphoribosyl)-5-[(5-phosphoribosylamino)methylideneamino]imidazole-4-carboxamide isomerase [Saprospiraceae bacterium]
MKIIPAIDIIDGKCVRLQKGDFQKMTIYNEDPLEVAKMFEDHGIQYLHLVDLDGARSKGLVNHRILEQISSKTNLLVDFGGGLKSDEDVRIAFESGASQVTGGSVALKDRRLFLSWLERYGASRIILGADCKNRKIASNGWLEDSEVDVLDFIESYEAEGILQVVATDIEKDGMLKGPSLGLYKEILAATKVELIASGGISVLEDLVSLKAAGCSGAIVGKAIYEGQISLEELSELC